MNSLAALDRFWTKVNKTDGCWLWTGATNNGYGAFCPGYGQRPVKAHRFAYELLVGPIPDNLVSDHLCLVKVCVRPEHVEFVSQGENVRRSNLHRGAKGLYLTGEAWHKARQRVRELARWKRVLALWEGGLTKEEIAAREDIGTEQVRRLIHNAQAARAKGWL